MEAPRSPARLALEERAPHAVRHGRDRGAGRVAGAELAAQAPRARRSTCLLFDPDEVRRRGILKYLSTFALEARGAGSPKVARAWLERERFDAIILYDAPEADGMAFLRGLRHAWSGPILLVARSLDDFSRIVALETGASDVVGEDCSRRELVARIRALLRLQPAGTAAAPPSATAAAGPSGRTAIRFHDLSLDLVRRRLSNEPDGMALRLGEAEFRLLCCLLLSDGQVLKRDELLATMYEGHEGVDARTIDVAVSRLRRAIRSISAVKDILVTVRGEGYRIAGSTIE